MFSDKDYAEYFGQIEAIYQKILNQSTDLMNELDNKAILSSLAPLTAEAFDGYRFVRDQKEDFENKGA